MLVSKEKGNLIVEAISHKNFLFAYNVIEQMYGRGSDTLIEITLADDGVVLYDGIKPVGVCLIRKDPKLDYPIIMECIVLDEYKGTRWAIRLMRETKRMLGNCGGYYIMFEEDGSHYKGETNSVKPIVETRSIGTFGQFILIRN